MQKKLLLALFMVLSSSASAQKKDASADRPLPSYRVEAAGFKSAERDIKAVCDSAAGELWRHLKPYKLEPFVVKRGQEGPFFSFVKNSRGELEILLDTGERGEVVHIGLRSTRILTRDDVEVSIPNGILGNTKIVNETGGPAPRQRVRVQVGVSYDSDLDQVREVLMKVAEAVDLVLDTPEPRVRFRAFGDSSLAFELLVWVAEPSVRGMALDALNTAVHRAFSEAGVQIPFPQRDLRILERS